MVLSGYFAGNPAACLSLLINTEEGTRIIGTMIAMATITHIAIPMPRPM